MCILSFAWEREREREREREEKSSTQTIFKFVEVKGKCIPKIFYKIELTNRTKKLQNAFNIEMKRALFSFLFFFPFFLYFRMSDFYCIDGILKQAKRFCKWLSFNFLPLSLSISQCIGSFHLHILISIKYEHIN